MAEFQGEKLVGAYLIDSQFQHYLMSVEKEVILRTKH